jgi:broad specificity phosphatase PhoE
MADSRLAQNGELRVALVRHAERADAAFSAYWNSTRDAVEYPTDPPLTRKGKEQARRSGRRLKDLAPSEGWGTVICSPFLRCVQTAVEICKVTGAPLIIDDDWGEVRFRDMLEMSTHQRGLTRSHSDLARLIRKEGIKLGNPDARHGTLWDAERPESLADARDRYICKFLGSLDAARRSRTSFVIVSHGECLPSCMHLFTEGCDLEVSGTPYCASIVGRLASPDDPDAPVEPLEPQPRSNEADGFYVDGLYLLETTCEIQYRQGSVYAGGSGPAHFEAQFRPSAQKAPDGLSPAVDEMSCPVSPVDVGEGSSAAVERSGFFAPSSAGTSAPARPAAAAEPFVNLPAVQTGPFVKTANSALPSAETIFRVHGASPPVSSSSKEGPPHERSIRNPFKPSPSVSSVSSRSSGSSFRSRHLRDQPSFEGVASAQHGAMDGAPPGTKGTTALCTTAQEAGAAGQAVGVAAPASGTWPRRQAPFGELSSAQTPTPMEPMFTYATGFASQKSSTTTPGMSCSTNTPGMWLPAVQPGSGVKCPPGFSSPAATTSCAEGSSQEPWLDLSSVIENSLFKKRRARLAASLQS